MRCCDSGGLLDRFTARAREVVVQAAAAAPTLRHSYIGTEHMLLGLLLEEQGVMRQQNDAGHVVMPGRRHVASLLKRWLPDRQQVQGQPRAPRHVPQKLVHHDALLDRVGCKTPIRPAAGDASARSA